MERRHLGAALYAFGPISMLGWIRVTRPWPRRFYAVIAFWIPASLMMGLDWVITPEAQREEMGAADLGGALLIGSVAIVVIMLLVDSIALLARLARRLRRRLGRSGKGEHVGRAHTLRPRVGPEG